MSIEINNLSKKYGDLTALSNITLSIKKGEIVGFLGPNGAGKSTLMKIICCYILQDSGDVNICGIDSRKKLIEVKSKIGYLSENNPLYQNMFIKEYLSFIANIYKLENSFLRTKEIITKVGLDSVCNKKIKELSKGYQQRVGLAAALIHDPEILILDEPTTGLDPNQLVEIRELIKKVGKNKTVLLSTHIMQEVDKICNRIVIINNGKIVEDQSISNIIKKKIDLEEYFRSLTK